MRQIERLTPNISSELLLEGAAALLLLLLLSRHQRKRVAVAVLEAVACRADAAESGKRISEGCMCMQIGRAADAGVCSPFAYSAMANLRADGLGHRSKPTHA